MSKTMKITTPVDVPAELLATMTVACLAGSPVYHVTDRDAKHGGGTWRPLCTPDHSGGDGARHAARELASFHTYRLCRACVEAIVPEELYNLEDVEEGDTLVREFWRGGKELVSCSKKTAKTVFVKSYRYQAKDGRPARVEGGRGRVRRPKPGEATAMIDEGIARQTKRDREERSRKKQHAADLRWLRMAVRAAGDELLDEMLRKMTSGYEPSEMRELFEDRVPTE